MGDASSEHAGLIRAWWAEYGAVLADPMNHLGKLDRLNGLTARCEAAGIVRAGQWMPDRGAEDLSAECQRLKARRRREEAGLTG